MKNRHFTIHQVPGRIGNITLIEYPNKLLLIDTGSKKDYKLLEQFILNNLGRSMGDMIVKMNETYHLPYSLPRPEMMEASLKKISALKVTTLILPHGGIDAVTDINSVTAPLFSEVYQKMPFPIGLLRPFTKLSPETKINM